MKRLFFVTLFLGSLTFIGCGKDDKASQKDQVMSHQAQWSELKASLGGDYQMFYQNTGFNLDTTTKFFIEVRDDQLSSSSAVTGKLTMDDLFQQALDVIDDKDCTLSISYLENKPVIKSYSARCHSESSGIEVTDFYEGHQINF